jgi:hypothetical protein
MGADLGEDPEVIGGDLVGGLVVVELLKIKKDCIYNYVKFRYSGKATKIWAIFHFLFEIS